MSSRSKGEEVTDFVRTLLGLSNKKRDDRGGVQNLFKIV